MAISHLEQELLDRIPKITEADLPPGTQLVSSFLNPDADKNYRVNLPFKSTGNKQVDQDQLVYWWMYVYQHYVEDVQAGRSPAVHAVYSTWSNALHDNFSFTGISGFWPTTGQNAVHYRPSKSAPTETQVAELSLWLPHIKPDPYVVGKWRDELLSKEKDLAHIAIMTDDLSASGVVQLHVNSDSEFIYSKTSWGRVHSKKLGNIVDAVGYMRKNECYGCDDEAAKDEDE